MSTHRKQYVKIKNGTDYSAKITLIHFNQGAVNATIYSFDSKAFVAAPRQTVGDLVVNFQTGFDTGLLMDYWGVVLELLEGPDKGTYVSEGNFITDKIGNLLVDGLKKAGIDLDVKDRPSFKECQLGEDDIHHIPTLEVNTSKFYIKLNSGREDTGMRKLDKAKKMKLQKNLKRTEFKTLGDFLNQDPAKEEDKIRNLDTLKQALILAMRLEFSTVPPYLCAQWSVAPDQEVGRIIRQVLIEEMHHFGLVGNILYAIGGKVNLLDSAFLPSYPTNMLPGGIEQKLAVDTVPLSLKQLEVFMQIENPGFTPADENARALMAVRKTYKHIGDFYKVIIDAFKNEDIKLTFDQDAPQIPIYGFKDGDDIEDKNKSRISSREDAIAAIQLILEEGEGKESDPVQPPESAGSRDELAHYYSFKEIHVGKQLIKKDKKWVYEGPEVALPGITSFEKKGPDEAFSQVFQELMKALQHCWTNQPTYAYPYSKVIMLKMEKIGRGLVSNGKCPIFSYPEYKRRENPSQ